jgi:hypothetical protein
MISYLLLLLGPYIVVIQQQFSLIPEKLIWKLKNLKSIKKYVYLKQTIRPYLLNQNVFRCQLSMSNLQIPQMLISINYLTQNIENLIICKPKILSDLHILI